MKESGAQHAKRRENVRKLNQKARFMLLLACVYVCMFVLFRLLTPFTFYFRHYLSRKQNYNPFSNL